MAVTSDQWSIILPKERVNNFINPVFGSTNGYATTGVNAEAARSTTDQRFDVYALELTTASAGEGVGLQTKGATGDADFVSFVDGSYTSTSGNVPTSTTGALLVDSGKRGNGVYADAALTNHLPNPRFVGTYSSGVAPTYVSFSAAGGAGTLSESSVSVFGGKSQRIQKTDGGLGSFGVRYTTTGGRAGATNSTMGVLIYVNSYTAGAQVRLLVIDNGGAGTLVSEIVDITPSMVGTWTYMSGQASGHTACSGNFEVRLLTLTADADLIVDAAIVSDVDYQIPFFSGATTGAAWSSTADNSTSTKAAIGLEYGAGLISATACRVEMWVKPYDITGATQFLLADSGTGVGFSITAAGNFSWNLGSGAAVTGTTTAAAGNWYHIAGTFTSSRKELYVNGVLEAELNGAFASSVLSSWLVGKFAGGDEAKALITGLQIYTTATPTRNELAVSFLSNSGTAMTVGTSGYTTTDSTATAITGSWYRHVAKLSNDADNVYLLQSGATGETRLIDGVQVEILDSASDDETTLVWGGAEGDYYWTGEPHNSTSKRGEFEPSGGYRRKFDADYKYLIEYNVGAAMLPIDVLTNNTPGTVGSALNAIEIVEREWSFIGRMYDGLSVVDFHAKRQALLKALHSFSLDGARRLFYSGAEVEKYIDAFYVNGGEGSATRQITNEAMNLRWLSTDPFFYEEGNRATALETANEITLTAGFTARIDGSWTTLAQPASVGGNKTVNALLHHNGRVYIGGDFLNWDGDADADYFTWYDIATNTYGSPPAGSTGIVYDMALDAAGNVIIGAANGVFAFDGSSFDQAIIGSPTQANGSVQGVLLDTTGTLWIVGGFTTMDGGAANGVAIYDGSSWDVPYSSTDGTGIINGIFQFGQTVYLTKGQAESSPSYDGVGELYPVMTYNINTAEFGFFGQTLVGLPATSVFVLQGNVYSVGDVLYIGDDLSFFPQTNQVASGAGGAGLVQSPNGFWALGAAGTLTPYGSDSTTQTYGIVSFLADGSFNIPVTPQFGNSDTVNDVIFVNDDIYIGGDFSGAIDHPGETQVSYSGTARSYPEITLSRSGGDTAVFTGLLNYNTGSQLSFDDYSLQDGETITVTTNPQNFSVFSSVRGFVQDAIRPNSTLDVFYFPPAQEGNSRVTRLESLIATTGDPTITAFVRWRNTYLGQD